MRARLSSLVALLFSATVAACGEPSEEQVSASDHAARATDFSVDASGSLVRRLPRSRASKVATTEIAFIGRSMDDVVLHFADPEAAPTTSEEITSAHCVLTVYRAKAPFSTLERRACGYPTLGPEAEGHAWETIDVFAGDRSERLRFEDDPKKNPDSTIAAGKDGKVDHFLRSVETDDDVLFYELDDRNRDGEVDFMSSSLALVADDLSMEERFSLETYTSHYRLERVTGTGDPEPPRKVRRLDDDFDGFWEKEMLEPPSGARWLPVQR